MKLDELKDDEAQEELNRLIAEQKADRAQERRDPRTPRPGNRTRWDRLH